VERRIGVCSIAGGRSSVEDFFVDHDACRRSSEPALPEGPPLRRCLSGQSFAAGQYPHEASGKMRGAVRVAMSPRGSPER
jgi:hypothetical protein